VAQEGFLLLGGGRSTSGLALLRPSTWVCARNTEGIKRGVQGEVLASTRLAPRVARHGPPSGVGSSSCGPEPDAGSPMSAAEPELTSEMVRRYLEGEGLAAIAATVGVNASTVRRRLLKAGVRRRPPSRRRLDVSTAEVARRYRRGESIGTIAQPLGTCPPPCASGWPRRAWLCATPSLLPSNSPSERSCGATVPGRPWRRSPSRSV
jgi:hypothetical protein